MKRIIILTAFSIVIFHTANSQKYVPAIPVERYSAGENVVSAGFGFGYVADDFNFSVTLEYDRLIAERLHLGVMFQKPLYRQGLYDTFGIFEEQTYRYRHVDHTYLFGMVYYDAPIARQWLSLRLGIGLGVGLHRPNPDGREAGIKNKLLLYENISAHWVITTRWGGEFQFPLLIIGGPGNFSYSPRALNGAPYVLNADIGYRFTFGYRF